jgi:3-oxoacyl-[acyl-carrier protein] reductase
VDRLVVVTGGGTGIGRAVAERFARDGDEVVILGRRGPVLDDATREINAACGAEQVATHVADLADVAQVESAAETFRPRGTVDVLVNNAGGTFGGAPSSLAETAAGWRRDFEGNVLTAVLLTEALEPLLAPRGSDRHDHVDRRSARRGLVRRGEGRAARLDAEPRDVPRTRGDHGQRRRAGLHPGHRVLGGSVDGRGRLLRVTQTPVGRPGTPQEVAAAVAYLASPDAGFTTRQILQVNGGWALGRG